MYKRRLEREREIENAREKDLEYKREREIERERENEIVMQVNAIEENN